jgi:imidazolonepropionase-like amidohydrolase
MTASVLKCGKLFDGESGELRTNQEILVEDGTITDIGPSVSRPADTDVIDLDDRTVSPGFIDAHVHLTMDASNLRMQTLVSTATKVLTGLSIAQGYLESGFTTVRDIGGFYPTRWDLPVSVKADDAGGPPTARGRHPT